jgi:excinuclease ABC subunit A
MWLCNVPELEPRMFSFNNPYGACAKCDGLGVIQYFNEKRLIQDDDVSISNGAIKGWTRRNRFYFYQLKCLSAHYDFTLNNKMERLFSRNKRYYSLGFKRKNRFFT